MKRFLTFFLALSLLLSLASCARLAGKTESGGEDPSDPQAEEGNTEPAAQEPASPVAGRTVMLITGDTEDPFYDAAREGARRYASQWGMELRCATGISQLAAVQQAMDEGMCGVCIAPEAGEALEAKLREARAAGLAVITWFSDVSSDARMLNVSQGTAAMLGPMLVEMGVESLRERGVDVDGEVSYVWHASDLTSPDQSAWYSAGRDYIGKSYPNWTMATEQPLCSGGSADLAVSVGESILEQYPDAALIICSDSTALPGQCRAAQNRGLSAGDVTITGFCPRAVMQPYLDAGVCARWGLWDCGMQAAMGCYLAAWLSEGNEVRVGDVINIPRIGCVELLANSELEAERETAPANDGVVLLPERVIFTADSAAGAF